MIIFNFKSATRTDESDNNDDAPCAPENDPQTMLEEELQQTKAQLHPAQAELEELRRESERSNKEANASLALAQQELQGHKEKAAAELNIFKFAIERFSTDDAIKFHTGFC